MCVLTFHLHLVSGLSHWQDIFQLGVNESYAFHWTEQAQINARKFEEFAGEIDRVIGDGWRNLKSLADGVKDRLKEVPPKTYPPSFHEKGYHTLWAIRSSIIVPAQVA